MRIAVLLAVLIALLGPGVAAHGVDVVVEQDRYVGSHAILVPPSVDEQTRKQLSECEGCHWRFTKPCVTDPETGEGGCNSVVRGCPAGRELLRVWFTQRLPDWEDRGLVCLLESDIVPVATLGRQARETFERRVPGPNPSCEPPTGAVTQLPVVCTSGQGGPRPAWNESLLGVTVQITAAPSWNWRFDPGAHLHTASPGGTYPDMSVSHTYRTPGHRRVEVTTEWNGSYTVDGLGPFPLETIRQVAHVDLSIGQARAVVTRR